MKTPAIISALLSAALAISAASIAEAQSLSVIATNALSFGDSYRQMTRTIAPDDLDAARFEVLATSGRLVRIWVNVMPASSLQAIPDGHASPGSVDITIDNRHCELSVDGGHSWHRFETGALSHDLRIPGDLPDPTENIQPARILVRVGGRLVVDDAQKRGEYAGRVILSAMYLDAPAGVE